VRSAAFRTSLACLIAYAALTIAFTWPVAAGLASDVPGDLGDSLLNMWILAWGADHLPQLLTGPAGWNAYWHGNIFHPDPYALALSEHLFGQALQIAPVYALTGNAILAYNLVFLSTFVLSAFGAFLLVRDLTGDWRAGFIAGLVYGFLPYRIAQIAHIQILSAQWMPFVLWGLHRYIAHGSTRALVGATSALLLQNWSCGYYLFFFAPFVPLFAVHQLWIAGRLTDRRAWIGLAGAGAVTLLLTLPFLLPYLEVQRLHGFSRPLGEIVYYSANVWSYLTASPEVHIWGRTLRWHEGAEGDTFLGIAAIVLALLAVAVSIVRAGRGTEVAAAAARWRRIASWVVGVAFALQAAGFAAAFLAGGVMIDVGEVTIRATTPVRLLTQSVALFALLMALSPYARRFTARWVRLPAAFFLGVLVLAMWLSLGPEPHAGPELISGMGLYSVLYEYVPGFTGLRVPARYAMLAGLFLSVLAGFGAAALLRRRWWGHAAVACAAVLIVADAAAMPLTINRSWGERETIPPDRVFPPSGAPPVYHRVAALPAGAVVAEFPFGDPAWEIRYVYYATLHRKSILNGYSGAFPPAYKERLAALTLFAANGDAAWRALMDAGTTHVIVHTLAFANGHERKQLEAWLESRGASLVESFADGDALYALPGGRRP
jgi:hypothetical protein